MAEEGVVIPVSLEPDLASTQKAGEEMGQKLTKVLEQNANIDLSDKMRKAEMQAKNLYVRFKQLSAHMEKMSQDSKTTPINQKEVDAALKEVDKLTAALDKQGEAVKKATTGFNDMSSSITSKAAERRQNFEGKLDKQVDSVRKAYKTYKDLDSAIKTNAEERKQKAAEKLQKAIDNVSKAQKKYESLRANIDTKAEERKQKAIESIDKAYERVKEQADKYNKAVTLQENQFMGKKGLSEMYRETAKGMLERTSSSYNNAVRNAKKYSDSLAKLEQIGANFRNKSAGEFITVNEISRLDVAKDKIKETQDALTKVRNSKFAVITDDEQIKLDNAKAKVDELYAALEKMQTDYRAKGNFITDDEQKKLDEAADKIRVLQEEYEKLRAELEQKQINIPELKFEDYFDTEQSKKDLRELEDVVNRLKMAMGTLESPDALAVMGKVAVKTANNISNLVKKLASLAKTAIQASIRKLGDGIKGIGTDSEKSNKSLDKLFKTFVKYGLGARSFFLLFRKIRSSIIDVFKALAEENKFTEVSKSVNALIDSLNFLKNSLVAAFTPIVNFVTPALTSLMDALAGVINNIGAFFSLLTGKSVYLKAIKQTGTLAKETEKGAKAQKKWKNELYGFDELNRPDKTDTGGNEASSGFEEVPIGGALSDWLKDWIERLKEAWKAENFYKVGQLLAEGLDHALKILDNWINNVFRPWGVKWAKNIADIVNGFFESWYLWRDLGKTISDGLVAVLDIASTFMERTHWESIGKAFGIMLESIFANSEMWTQIARFVANRINMVFKLLHGFLQETVIYARSWGKTLFETFRSTIMRIDWNLIVDTIETGVRWVIQAINGFLLDNEGWEEIRKVITRNINRIFSEPDWKGLGDALNRLIKRVLEILAGLDWYQIGYTIGEFLGQIDWLGILSTVGKIIVDALWGVITGFLSTDNGKAVAFAGLFVSLLSGAFTVGFEFLKLEITKGLAASILNPAMLASGQATTLLGTIGSAFTSLGGVISGAFGAIASAAAPIAAVVGVVIALSAAYGGLGGVVKKVGEVFGNAIERVKEFAKQIGISEAIDKLKTSFGNLLDMLAKLKPVWDVLFAAIGAVVEGVLNMVIGAITGLATVISGIVDVIVGVLTIIGDAFTDTHGHVEESLTLMATGIMNIFVGISQAVIGVIGGFVQAIIDFFLDLKYQLIGDPIIVDLWEGIKSIFENGIKFVVDAIGNFISNIITAFTAFLANSLQVFTTMWTAIQATTSSIWNAISSFISTTIDTIKTTVSNTVNNLKTDIIARWNELQSTTLSIFNNLKSTLISLWNGLKSSLKSISFVDVGKGIVNGIKSGINELWNRLKESFLSKVRDLVDSAKRILQIGSPSKVFAEIGKDVALGLAQGIINENAPEKATEEMVDSITDVDAALNSMPDSFDTIIDKLSIIADKFTIINDTLMNASRIPMPAVATGMVTPSFVNTASNDEPSLADSIANAISLALENMPRGTNTSRQDIKVYIRGKEVFDAVVAENDSAIMRTGKSPLVR